ncbi:MAG: hypothetical protein ACRDK0_04375 [Solirubrobacteraceae bacterium]
MSKTPPEQPRGEAAWKAAKQRIADNNEAAYARGRRERAARNAQAGDDRRASERQDRMKLPTQPGR